ncbi:MAG: osmotically inducible protein C [Candidatus Cloacimonadota bacterium]|nr:MAG: osmotically inducible protein C [Candidatus Cloacimonadota bacterium]
MEHKTVLSFKEGMKFEAELNNHKFYIDAGTESGGNDEGPRPKGLMLTALAGCTGMDVVSILRKMRVTDFKLNIEVKASLTTDHPVVYENIDLYYMFEGENLPKDKIIKAVDLSENRYCGVSAMLKKAVPIKAHIIFNGEEHE